jgi:hypothetical protein
MLLYLLDLVKNVELKSMMLLLHALNVKTEMKSVF